MSNETNLNAAQTNHIFSGKGGKMYKRISFVLAVALAVNLFGMVTPTMAQPVATVPDVVGMTEAAARSAIYSCDLRVRDISYEYSDTVLYAQVISQDPEAGTWVPEGSAVDLVICGPQMVDVPDVVGMSQADAESEITSAGLIAEHAAINPYLYSDTVPAGHVIRHHPAGGTSVCIGASVGLVICEKYKVPNVVGMTEAAARGALSSRHLSVANCISREYSDTVPEGRIISQDPEAGTWVRRNYTVDLVICGSQMVDVPDVVGMYQWYAERAIHSNCWLVSAISRVYSATVAKGYVISQDPPGGTSVPIGSNVDLTISQGPPGMVEVPDVVGWWWELAMEWLYLRDLVYSHDESSWVFSDTVGEDHVISQNPAAGTVVAKGSTVLLTISLGSCQTRVPDVVGMPEGDAKQKITSHCPWLVPAISRVYSDTVAEGYVISQDPAARTLVDCDSTVNLTISLGLWTVPDVVGMSESDAASAINSAELSVGSIGYLYSDTVPAGCVISTYPRAGTVVDAGSEVDLDISMGPDTGGPTVEVPDVVGMTESDAKSVITFASLNVGTISNDYSDTVPKGFVISQSPSGGTSVSIGSSVNLTISLGPWTVPDVVGMTYADAASAINSAVLSVGSIGYLYSDTVPAGCVISSYPRAGIVVDAGTEVDLDISMGPEPRDVPPIPVPPDASCLLAHWKLDEIEGAIAYDSSGNGNHGMVYGNPIWQPTGGVIDGTLEFDGDGDYVEVPKIGESVEFTYAMWVAQNQIGSGLIALIDHKDWVYGSVQFELRDGHPKVVINGAITPAADLDAWGHTLAAGEWHHVALAKSATELLMYVDGEEAARSELTMSDTVILGDGFIGAWVNPTWGQTRYFDGWVDDVRIYACALEENQIKALISAPPPPEPPSDPLSEALDTSLSFTTGGGADWFSQTTTSYHDGDAAQSGDISKNQESWMQTTVSGKGTVSFYWKVSSERYCDFLKFYIDEELQDEISGSVDWQQKTYAITTLGLHTLEWQYSKDYDISSGSDCGWVDKVEWVTTP